METKTALPIPPYMVPDRPEREAMWAAFQEEYGPRHPGGGTFRAFIAGWDAGQVKLAEAVVAHGSPDTTVYDAAMAVLDLDTMRRVHNEPTAP